MVVQAHPPSAPEPVMHFVHRVFTLRDQSKANQFLCGFIYRKAPGPTSAMDADESFEVTVMFQCLLRRIFSSFRQIRRANNYDPVVGHSYPDSFVRYWSEA